MTKLQLRGTYKEFIMFFKCCSTLMSKIKRTYEISPKAEKASLKVCVSISGLRSPTNM
ncbi:hypothetical protein ALC53_02595 [Atta colombica]|uniref:Uncharacterized protein n=1 Tax=Atta colombica TaxID=520822 RepID=A0A195BS37_9HYME|nr:hypothetical protein ALC53_02595 [Atta colombica]